MRIIPSDEMNGRSDNIVPTGIVWKLSDVLVWVVVWFWKPN
jgi:hypothetical protein